MNGWPPDESLHPDETIVRMLVTLHHLDRDAYDRAIAETDDPEPHPAGHFCVRCLAGRLIANQPPPLVTYGSTRAGGTVTGTFSTDAGGKGASLDSPDSDHDTRPEETPMATTTTSPTTVRTAPCPSCGIASPVPSNVTPSGWRLCDDCRRGTDESRAAAMLASLGIEDRADDPAVVAALRGVAWKANTSPATSTPCPKDGGQHASCLVGSHPRGRGTDRPWEHMDARAVRRAIKQARTDADRPPRLLARPGGGGCNGCGVTTSTVWFDHASKKRPDFILCSACSAHREKAGGSDVGWRNRLCADLLDVPPTMLLASRYSFVPFEETEAQPSKTRFAYVDDDVVQACRAAHFAAFPLTAPKEFRDRAERIAVAKSKVIRRTDPVPAMVAPRRGTVPAEGVTS